MNYMRLITVPLLAALAALLFTACPKPDETNVSVNQPPAATPPPATTEINNNPPPATPPPATNVNVTIKNEGATNPVEANSTVTTKYPDVVTVVEKQVATPTPDATVYFANAPAQTVWTTKIVPAKPPADVVYYVRDLDVAKATPTEITANGYVLVAAPEPTFVSQRKYVTYTFRQDNGAWKIYDIKVDRTVPATKADLAIFTSKAPTPVTKPGAPSPGAGGGTSTPPSGGGY